MRSSRIALAGLALLLAACDSTPPEADDAALRDSVEQTELSFARSMAERDFAAFEALLSDEAVFVHDGGVLRGKSAIAAVWKPYFASPQAPFSWKPEHVAVLASGTLAQSSGPVLNPQGQVIGRFHSIWRREKSGSWRIVFDDGDAVTLCAPAGAAL
ncbi:MULTISPECIES: YybH family protein [Hydrocarboniphaga]|jgi:ketosteroid isomerase-like protein|uniref:DUF4440 domain-containing protein n=1 Tax=Hydrocarboniphaga effusa AP103 TaxID=1172194 RepID=I7ZEM8_9GAMM|nr:MULTISPECIES: nuclear transport factor 2 family protein [Hydrocarboniphaga]EIT70349.1 hypothetical protein WQQ_04860 [Hydrocarboniphaga effusa AP103]MDZ4077896.1 nuclear transport factor 2 family protein [Hydrocarboniphaga sp.]